MFVISLWEEAGEPGGNPGTFLQWVDSANQLTSISLQNQMLD